MRFAAVFIVLLLVASATALSFTKSSYIVVVGKDAPATDVVIAANFAASMKGFAGVTFESAIDEEAYDNIPDIAGRTIVVIDGARKQVRITETDTGAAAKTYFQQQGFEVVPLTSRDDLLLTPKTSAVAIVPSEPVVVAVEDNVSDTSPEQDTPAEQPVPEPDPAPLVVPQKQENPPVLTRIWHWFTNLF